MKRRCVRKRALFISGFIILLGWLWLTDIFSKVYCAQEKGQNSLNKLCSAYTANQTSGNLCDAICSKKISLTCNGYHGGKTLVLKAEMESKVFVLKSASIRDIEIWDPELGPEDLLATVETKLKLDFPHYSTINVMSYFKSYDLTLPVIRQTVWNLANDHEFVLALVLQNFAIFPKVFGHCGPFYAVEYVETLESTTSSQLHRFNVARELVQFLEKLRLSKEELFLCDVKASHFGRSSEGVWKYVDLDAVFPRSMLERNIKLRSECNTDLDCSFFDCKSSCGASKKCDQRILSSNLQVVCANILAGGAWFGGGFLQASDSVEVTDALKKCTSDPSFTEAQLIRAIEMAMKQR